MMKRIVLVSLALMAPALAGAAKAAPQCSLPTGRAWQSGVTGLSSSHPIYFLQPDAAGVKWSGVQRTWAETERTLIDLGKGRPRASIVLLTSPAMSCTAAKRLQREVAKSAKCGSMSQCAVATKADLAKLPRSERLPHGLD